VKREECEAAEKIRKDAKRDFQIVEEQMDLLRSLFRSLTDELHKAGFAFAQKAGDDNDIKTIIKPYEERRKKNPLPAEYTDTDLTRTVPRYFLAMQEVIESLVPMSTITKRYRRRDLKYFKYGRNVFTLTMQGCIITGRRYIEYTDPPFAFRVMPHGIEAVVFNAQAAARGEEFEYFNRETLKKFLDGILFTVSKISEIESKRFHGR